jgi:hypothetical protein
MVVLGIEVQDSESDDSFEASSSAATGEKNIAPEIVPRIVCTETTIQNNTIITVKT